MIEVCPVSSKFLDDLVSSLRVSWMMMLCGELTNNGRFEERRRKVETKMTRRNQARWLRLAERCTKVLVGVK